MSNVVIIPICLLISLIWNILFWDRSYGISMPLFAVIVVSLLLGYKRAELSKVKRTLFIHLLLLIYLSICVACYRNSIILYATIPAVFLGLCAAVFMGQEGYSFSNFVGVVESLAKKILCAFFTAPEAFSGVINKLARTDKASRSMIKVFIGIVISVPFLILFGGLFTSADPVFEKYLRNVFEYLWKPDIFERGLMILIMWVFLCGYLVRNAKYPSLESHLSRTEPKRNFDGIVVFVFLLMNNLLFLCFIVIQLEYLFGGEQIIRNTSFTYAEYTHKGFYEFWATVILVSIIILYTDFKLRDQAGRIRQMVQYGWIALICQTLVIIASGLKRIFVYEEAYGYTYLRILVALFFLFAAGSFLLFIFKIIRQKTTVWLISGGLSLAFVFLAFVSVFSIDRYIARKNVDRYLKHDLRLDMDYLSYLSTDTYPEMVRLKTEAKDEWVRDAAERILQQQAEAARDNLSHWASWNLSLSQVKK